MHALRDGHLWLDNEWFAQGQRIGRGQDDP
jgi:hypothetical protein